MARQPKQVTGIPMSKPLVLNTTNARLTAKYAGLTARFVQWCGESEVLIQVFLTEDEMFDDMSILYSQFTVPSVYKKGDEKTLLEKFALETELTLEYDPPLAPLAGEKARPNGEYDKFRAIAKSPFGTVRDLCAPVQWFREFVAWVP